MSTAHVHSFELFRLVINDDNNFFKFEAFLQVFIYHTKVERKKKGITEKSNPTCVSKHLRLYLYNPEQHNAVQICNTQKKITQPISILVAYRRKFRFNIVLGNQQKARFKNILANVFANRDSS